MGVFLFDSIVFGPVYSRRLGISLGINLLPNNSKICNFNCIYCECGLTKNRESKNHSFHPVNEVVDALENRLKNLRSQDEKIDTITFAGNGEPTLHPNFPEIVEKIAKLRDEFFLSVKIALLSNSTTIGSERIYNALSKVDLNILKLDSAREETIKRINCPLVPVNLKKMTDNFKKFNGKFILQTLFIKGTRNKQSIDNTTDKEVNAWLDMLDIIKPERIMVYTISRDTPVDNLEKVPLQKLEQIANKARLRGYSVDVSG